MQQNVSCILFLTTVIPTQAPFPQPAAKPFRPVRHPTPRSAPSAEKKSSARRKERSIGTVIPPPPGVVYWKPHLTQLPIICCNRDSTIKAQVSAARLRVRQMRTRLVDFTLVCMAAVTAADGRRAAAAATAFLSLSSLAQCFSAWCFGAKQNLPHLAGAKHQVLVA